MEVFTRVLGKLKGSKGFKFHPKCSRINLTHLMFADVIIFSKANVESLVKIKEAITLFYEFSGLKVSCQKSAIYFGGCSEVEMNIMANVVGFLQGKLPFLYLGVPLDGTSIRGATYNSVIDDQ
ncbi:hypothetical protein QQ045_001127 [Rhodiola kirilowii]